MSRNSAKKRRKARANLRKPMPPPARPHKDRRREKDLRDAERMMREIINPFGFDDN